ncbi:MAG: molybdopterin oxidoreductase family protein [Hydrocarboniphaga sp.]|uniref:molybdopterin-dependent oxidoreductase n=1 Tax=Hydrocarboniphaga sp. TaxID=2033016 RepID=UPI0026175D4F|nr:molybdopterin-dependent oxidoreductase [Hydrocarboniphaga sp.]MDB5971257.1 molybdopterin oxidoreductase family protein [Hydrocarboniphaga sp.]
MEERIHYGACNLCEAICGLEFRVAGREIRSIRGDEADPLSRGHICPKAVALKDIDEDPDRLRHPLIREDGIFRQASWDEALDRVAERLVQIHNEHGADAIATYLGNPTVHNYGAMTHASHFLGHFKTRNRYSATSVDQLPHQLVVWWMYGHQLLVPIADIDHTNYFFVLGANPMASNGSLMTVPDFRARLKALQARGGKMVVLDPRRSETADVADEYHAVRPGGDAAFLLGFVKTLFDEQLTRPGRLAAFSDGLAELPAALAAFDIEMLAAQSGIDSGSLRRLAREFAAADGAAMYGRMGVSTQRHGTLCQWLIQLINLLTGNLDRVGGVLFTRPAVDLIGGPASKPGSFGRWKSRVRGLPEFGGELPVAALAEEVLTPGAGQIRALVTHAGNPVMSTPNGRQLDRALASLEFMVAIDLYLNETTRHADVILPPTPAVEHDQYDLIFHIFAVRNTARWSAPTFDKSENALHDWEIFTRLGEKVAARLGTQPRPAMRPEQIIDLGLQAGPYGAMQNHPLKLSLKALKAAPHGIDLGALQPSLPQRLVHADQRIRCAPAEMLEALQRYHQELMQPARAVDGELRLIGRRHLRSNNSWMHNSQRLTKGPSRHQLLMHPQDLQSRSLADGSRVRVRSRTGEIVVEVQASADMMPGVVSLPHGWGHDRAGTRMEIAQRQPGASANDLTDELELDVSGNAALNGLAVQVLGPVNH